LVYIKRVDLRGFKTFGKKATVHFSRGLTIITGPNGSGKSNILDSVKFALGELSPKELRGETIGDLIHKGAQSATTRSAYVAVQFDNHDRRIPIDAEAITISREFRRGGEGIYRLNGKRVSRKQLTDILSSADIQVSSYNIVPQHAITRLAEVTTEERRRIIEDMIGIAVYDTKKASAQAELQQANLNLQVASAKIEEVRLRVESLERERNDYLKYQQVRKEINQLQAKAISCKITKEREEASQLAARITENQQQLQNLKTKRDKLLQQKSNIESEREEYENSVAEQGNAKLVEVQRLMGDVSATIARLQAQANATEANISLLQRQKVELEQSSTQIMGKVTEAKSELQSLTEQQVGMLGIVEAKQREVDESAGKLTALRTKLGEHNKEAEGLEKSINIVTSRIVKFEAQTKASAAKIDLLDNHLRTITSRKEEHETLVQDVIKRIEELTAIKTSEETRLHEAQTKISEYPALKTQRQPEIIHANEVAKRAEIAVAEIETQKNVAENLASDDKALALIEEMAAAGTVTGVYGRLGDLVKADSNYAKATEAAAAGWMKAIVVRDIETAIACIEVLKKTRIGRVKLVPLGDIVSLQKNDVPKDLPDIVGPISEQLKFDEKFKPAVHYVFGDTVLALNQKSAFRASLQGIRAVAISGDLYEPGGAMETGYFRQPYDLSKLLLSGKTVNQLKNTLTSLEKLATRTEEDMSRIEREIVDWTNNKAQMENLIASTEKEISTFAQNLERTRKSIEESTSRIDRIEHEIGTERAILEASNAQFNRLKAILQQYEESHGSLKLHSQSTILLQVENEHSQLAAELNGLIRQRMEIENKLKSIESTISIIEPSIGQASVQNTSIDKQLQELTTHLASTQTALASHEDQLKQHEANRNKLSEELVAVRETRSKYDAQLRVIESEITTILDKLDPLNTTLANLQASHKHLEMQSEFHMTELKDLGYSEVLNVKEEEMAAAESILPTLKKELATIGGVNELAVSQYEEVKDNYKHLATRIYELEKEKLSILEFMNTLDQQKFEAFMKAFNQVSQSFNEIFQTVTGGVGKLFLENPETPFVAGADIKLQFPGKTLMTIGSASGGEKSVGTVCFILALQAIHPMPFYMMDEIDAHLDVVNSQRLAELLKSKSQGSQFIIVSLKDVTITRADAVYGVFIQDGVSQVVGLPLQEARAIGRSK
jgi:chromosome segregation protein